jgi:hypothetical protein
MALLSEAARGPCQGGSSVRSREDGASKGGGNGVRRRPRRRVYEYDTLERATAGFAEENRVESSSVYRAVIDGDAAAVKRVEGDVGAEVTVLGRVNHARLVRLCGLCVHRGDTHLVFEFIENGALSN